MKVSTGPRIAFAAPEWPPETATNGITSYVARVRQGLSALGVDSAVVSARVSGEAAPDVYNLAQQPRLPAPVRLVLGAVWKVAPDTSFGVSRGVQMARELARHPAVDVLELEESLGLAAAMRPFFRGSLIVRTHGPWEVVGPAYGARDDVNFRVRVAAEWLAMRAADAVTAPSRAVLDGVQQRHHAELPHASVIPNPAELVPEADRWSPRTRVSERVLFVGRFDRVKGPDILFTAMEQLVARRPALQLVFVGPARGLEADGRNFSLDEYLAERVSADVRARIDVRGALPPAEIRALRQTAHVTVVSSRFENFPMTALEALASGSPLVASDAGGIPEIVRDGVNALSFRSEDATDLAAKMERVLGDDALAQSLSDAAIADCADRFSIAQVARLSLDVYEAARARRAARRGRWL